MVEVEERSNAPTKSTVLSATPASVNNNKTGDDFDDDDLLAIALPWLCRPTTTIVRSAGAPINRGGTTIIYQSSSLPSGEMERRTQSSTHVGCDAGDKEERKAKQLHCPTDAAADGEDKDTYDYFIRGKLARRAYHLPDNTYCQDYKQYIANCHLIFGLCCSDKRSPVRMKHRLLILCGSLAFGLNITNIIYLWGNQVFHDEEITSAFKEWAGNNIPTYVYNGTKTNTILEDTVLEDALARLNVDMGSQLTILWTAGAFIHAAFDVALWHMISCGYCSYSSNATNRQRQDCLIFGWTTAIAIVMMMIIATCVVIYFRVVFPLTNDNDEIRIDEQMLYSFTDDEIDPAELVGFLVQGDFSFVLAFIIEFAVSLFIWTPLLMTTLFTGVLGCGRIPCIGGRPREVWRERNGKDGRRLYLV